MGTVLTGFNDHTRVDSVDILGNNLDMVTLWLTAFNNTQRSSFQGLEYPYQRTVLILCNIINPILNFKSNLVLV
jgi:hypothetical protein